MLKEPKKCSEMGEYECQIPMPIKGRVHGIDLCIADLVAALNASNLVTDASCCGHKRQHGIISLVDGRQLVIVNDMQTALDMTLVAAVGGKP